MQARKRTNMNARVCVCSRVCACCSCCLLRLGRSAPSPCCRVLAKEVGVARHLRYCFIITVRRIISATQPRAKTLQIRCTHRQINLPGAPPPLVRPVVIYAIAASSRRTSNGRNFFHEGSPRQSAPVSSDTSTAPRLKTSANNSAKIGRLAPSMC